MTQLYHGAHNARLAVAQLGRGPGSRFLEARNIAPPGTITKIAQPCAIFCSVPSAGIEPTSSP